MSGSNIENRWQRIEELFARASECPPADRARRLEEWCGGDEELRREVQSLLEAADAADAAQPATVTEPTITAPSNIPAPEPDRWIGRTIGAYRLERLIACGGMGAVYFARRVSGEFQQEAAFKVVPARLTTPWSRQRFLLERQTLAALEHSNIARLLDGGITDVGEPYLVMEYIEGQRLDEYCQATNASVPQIVKLTLQLCDAVAFVHRNLIVHRDLKPGNVLVTEDGTVKLLDFGAAKLLDPAGQGSNITRMGIRPLTPQYASPEQILGAEVTTASDIYSLGVILYSLLTGRLPFGDPTLSDTRWVEARLESGPVAPNEAVTRPAFAAGRQARRPVPEVDLKLRRAQIRGDLDAIVLKALKPDPKDRYRSVDEFSADLRNYLEDRPVSAREGSLAYRARKLVRRRARPIAAAAAILLASSGAVVATVREGRVAAAEAVRAASGYTEVRHLANLLLFDFYNQVRQLQGSTAVQRELVSVAVTYLDGLTLSVAGDPGLQLDLVDAYTKMGNVLGNPYEENLGDAPKAIATIEKAMRMGEEVVRRRPHDDLALRRLAIAKRSLAEVWFSTGDTARAVQYSREAAELLQRLAARPGAALADIQEAASTLDSLGDMYGLHGNGSTGDLRSALEVYRQALAFHRQVLAIAPNNVRSLRGLGVEQMKIANAQSEADPAAAAQGYRDALATIQRLPSAARESAPILRLTAVIRHQLANLYLSTGQAADALPYLEALREHGIEATMRDPQDVRARFDLATADYDLGHAREELGDSAGARDAYREALRVLGELLQRDGSNLVWVAHRSDALYRLSAVEWSRGAREAATQDAREALALALRVAASAQPSGEDFQRAAEELLEVQPESLRNPARALELAQRAVEISRGGNVGFLITLAKAQRANGQVDAARATAQKALALLPAVSSGQPGTQVRRVAEGFLRR